MPSILSNGRLVSQSKRCLSRAFHTNQNLQTKPTSMPRFQKPGSSPKEGFEKINVGESAGTPNSSTLLNPVEAAKPVRVVAPETRATPRIVDTSSKEYKQAERQWVSVIVALPILFVTSYFLFDRLALGHVPPSLPGTAPKITESVPRPEQKPEGAA